MKRHLVLRKETLAELADRDLASIVGGQYTSPEGVSCGIRNCVPDIVHIELTSRCPASVDPSRCPTLLC